MTLPLSFNDLLRLTGLAPGAVQLMRHKPREKVLVTRLRGIRTRRPDLFTTYQAWQNRRLFNPAGVEHIASFLADGVGRALFAGIWRFDGLTLSDAAGWSADPGNIELIGLGMDSWVERPRANRAHYDHALTDLLADATGRLLVEWRTEGQRWSHRADRKDLPVIAIHEVNRFDD